MYFRRAAKVDVDVEALVGRNRRRTRQAMRALDAGLLKEKEGHRVEK